MTAPDDPPAQPDPSTEDEETEDEPWWPWSHRLLRPVQGCTNVTTKKEPTRHARKVSLTRRVLAAHADLMAANGERQELAYGTWLRRMAGCRTAVAALYRAAAREFQTDSIEWHALIDAAIMLELHAAANISHANAYGEPDAAAPVTGPVLVGVVQ